MNRMMDAMVRTIACCLFALLACSASSAHEPAGHIHPPELTQFPDHELTRVRANAGKAMVLKAMDERMRAVMEHYFPDRTIVQVDPREMNWRGGGVHCWTQQQPISKE